MCGQFKFDQKDGTMRPLLIYLSYLIYLTFLFLLYQSDQHVCSNVTEVQSDHTWEESDYLTPSSRRQGKYLFPVVVVHYGGDTCYSKSLGMYGNCYSAKQCLQDKGKIGGLCSKLLGVCCAFRVSCNGSVNHNNTYIQSRNFPGDFKPNGYETCTTDILRTSSDICQVKVDFISMNIEQGDSNGACKIDGLLIRGTPGSQGTIPPNLCGPLTDQSIYLEFGDSQKISLSIYTNGFASNMGRSWNMRVNYIKCNDVITAPTGCLQYYTGIAGHVKILGYPQSPHLGDLAYSVCVRPERGARSITWTRCPQEELDKSFWFTGGPVSKGISAQRVCNGDYVLIMSTLSYTETSDRYCGNALYPLSPLLGITSFEKPFLMRVKTDGLEGTDEEGNTGFCLQWRQNF